jgi:SprT protein
MVNAVTDEEYLFLADKIEQKVKNCLYMAEQQFQQSFNYHSIEINIRGRAAGQIRYSYTSTALPKSYNSFQNAPILRFNPYLLVKYRDTFIDQVVPHECAHLVAYALFGMKIKPHGAQWKALMIDLYKLPADVTHRYEMPKKTRPSFDYSCGCIDLVHKLSVIRHNKIKKHKAVYSCKKCRTSLIFKH